MKRLITVLLALAMLLSMVACTTEPPKNDTEKNQPTGTTAADSATETTAAAEIRFEDLLVVDNDACIIKITDLEEDGFWGYTLKVYMENKTADKSLMFSVDSAAVNGVDSDPLFAAEVPAGKKATDSISFMDPELEKIIERFTDIELNFSVSDSEDWTAEPIATPTIHVYPYGESNATVYKREAQDTDTVIMDNEYAKVIVTGYGDDHLWGYTAKLYIENKSDVSLMVSADEVSVNGFMADPFFATSVSAGKCAFGSMSWADDVLKESDITAVETIEFTLCISDENDWLADDFASETVTLNP